MEGTRSITLGYWDFRGYGESCRYMLVYCGCEFEDKHFTRSGKSDYSAWRSVSENFGLDFPNKLTESVAILKYLGRKHDLFPKNEEDNIRADMIQGVLLDIRQGFYDIFFHGDENYRKCAENFKTSKFLPKARKLVQFMGDRKWLVSNQLTYLDFMFYAQLSQQLALFPKILDDLKRLQVYMSDFQALPRVAGYLKSEKSLGEYPEHDPYIKKGYIVEDL